LQNLEYRWAFKIAEAAAETEKTTLKKVSLESIIQWFFLPFDDHGISLGLKNIVHALACQKNYLRHQ
jgi:hypothetical protein